MRKFLILFPFIASMLLSGCFDGSLQWTLVNPLSLQPAPSLSPPPRTGPAEPSLLQLVSPASSPGNINRPIVRIGGVSSGDTIELHSNTTCTSLLASGIAEGTSIDLQSSPLADGRSSFHAKAVDPQGHASQCSKSTLTYELDTAAVNVTGLSDDPTPRMTKTWNWGCNKSACVYRFVINQLASATPSGTFAPGNSAEQLSGNGIYYLHIQAKDLAGNLSQTVSVSALLDNTAPATPGPVTLLHPSTGAGTVAAPTIRIYGVDTGDTISLHVDPKCDDSKQVASGLASGGAVSLTSSALAPGVYTFHAKAKDIAGNTSGCSNPGVFYQYYQAVSCPSGFIPVPENPAYLTSTFCVAKFPMKAVDANGELMAGGNGSGTWSNGVLTEPVPTTGTLAVSRPDGGPWVGLTRNEAAIKCNSMSSSSAAYHLITHAEWQTIARSIENTSSNWSGGAVGSGILNQGHSDGATAEDAIDRGLAFAGNYKALASSSTLVPMSDTNGYAGTGNTANQQPGAGWEQRRTHQLLNNEVIWDFGGNVVQWVADNNTTHFGETAPISQVTAASHPTEGTIGTLSGIAKFLFGPAGEYTGLNSGLFGGLGTLSVAPAGTLIGGAILRGGAWYSGASAGIFATNLANSPMDSGFAIGFRCAYWPSATSAPPGSQ